MTPASLGDRPSRPHHIPRALGRIGTADDLAEHYLSFMRGRYVTDRALVVDGGGVLV